MIFLFLCREVCSCCQKISSQPIDLCFLLASVHFGPREQGMFLDKGIASNYPAVPTAAMQGSPHSQSCSWGPVSESLAIAPFIILTEEFNWGKTESFLEIDFALISRVINTYHLCTSPQVEIWGRVAIWWHSHNRCWISRPPASLKFKNKRKKCALNTIWIKIIHI